ncbi:MAG: restriction endonuclease, partial [Deltaproteobacteria bacterium]|nr:restriction endonuclease [Deltaproteobacteria bacterium]
SNLPKNAYAYVKNIDNKVVLIDGNELANLMIEHDVGVSIQRTFAIRKIDSDYFIEE